VSGAVPAPPASALARTRAEVRAWVRDARASGKTVALVPTMGALHDGHLALVDRARAEADRVVMSIFVNPLQFGPGEDLERYPRDLDRDRALATGRGVDLVFAPSAAEMYPRGAPQVSVVPGPMADLLCGAARPGHFRGVLTVVAKLFGIVAPDVAVFGQKDFQQATLLRHMVEDLEFPVRVEVAPTVREPDGLAMSSRNVYLSTHERARALALSHALERCRALFSAGERDADTLRAALRRALAAAGLEPEYAEVADPDSLEPVRRALPGTVCLVAARVGATRLIDNAVLP
jgi:pantoate--beta-alanine ligase